MNYFAQKICQELALKKRKRRFYGNRFTAEGGDQHGGGPSQTEPGACSSAKKIKICDREASDNNRKKDGHYYIMIHFNVIEQIVKETGRCPHCNDQVKIVNNLENKKGLSCNLVLNCRKCKWSTDYYTSPCVEKKSDTPGPTSFDVNIRSVFAFREIGKGHKSMSNFSTYMNMPPPMSKTRYQSINGVLHDAYESVAEESMKLAGKESHELIESDSQVKQCKVSIDGTWQRRGYASLNGAVTAISPDNGKCLDIFLLSKSCKSCELWSKRTDHPKYDEWKTEHVCPVNHTTSSGAMESAGAVAIFNRSEEKHSLAYSTQNTLGMVIHHHSLLFQNHMETLKLLKESVLAMSRSGLVPDAEPSVNL